ncbi:hypothetical protein LPW36_05420 [Jinshanibacter sp. LJY008]|uniref:Uncharacterized protein n=1 Tax=Limnobaculum eriocheiris TaxID=2897391 RepID=A0A9X1MVS7_9GAMM|nr:hypothetical protein [Limnobaculum eriocheiris]MCD1125458.1 hypothetical protein [Limnobaculum eriocheiris]
MAVDLNKSDILSRDIENYSKHINEFRSQANIQGIWLFTSTLGCWSVSVPVIQLIAAVLLLFIFVFLVNKDIGDKREFYKIKEEIEKDINDHLTGDTRMARLYELEQVEGYRKSIKPVLKSSPVFIVCYIFYSISIMSFLANLMPQYKFLPFY